MDQEKEACTSPIVSAIYVFLKQRASKEWSGLPNTTGGIS